jgi:hypothetical protein
MWSESAPSALESVRVRGAEPKSVGIERDALCRGCHVAMMRGVFYSGNWRASRLHLNHIRSSLATSQPAPPEMEQGTVLSGCPARGRKA